MNLKFNNYLFFNKKDVGTKNRLLRLYGVKRNSYAGKVLARIYDSYFGKPISIKKEFSKYYKREFPCCEQYLVCRFNMPEELAKRICDEKQYYVHLDWQEEQPGLSFSYDEELKMQFWEFVGGLSYEG